MSWRKLWLEADSSDVVWLLAARPTKVPWRFAARWDKVLTLLLEIDLQVLYIYREGNVVADIMANHGTPSGWWDHEIPIIEEAVRKDAYAPRFLSFEVVAGCSVRFGVLLGHRLFSHCRCAGVWAVGEEVVDRGAGFIAGALGESGMQSLGSPLFGLVRLV